MHSESRSRVARRSVTKAGNEPPKHTSQRGHRGNTWNRGRLCAKREVQAKRQSFSERQNFNENKISTWLVISGVKLWCKARRQFAAGLGTPAWQGVYTCFSFFFFSSVRHLVICSIISFFPTYPHQCSHYTYKAQQAKAVHIVRNVQVLPWPKKLGQPRASGHRRVISRACTRL